MSRNPSNDETLAQLLLNLGEVNTNEGLIGGGDSNDPMLWEPPLENLSVDDIDDLVPLQPRSVRLVENLHQALNSWDTRLVKKILKESSVDVNQKGNFRSIYDPEYGTIENETPLFIACFNYCYFSKKNNYEQRKEYLEIAELLLDKGADLLDVSVIFEVVNQYEFLELLVKKAKERSQERDLVNLRTSVSTGFPVFGRSKPILHQVIELGELKSLKLLLENGANANEKDNVGQNSLHKALSRSKFEAAKILVEYVKDVNLKDSERKTPLHIAISNNFSIEESKEFVELLIRHGADVNEKSTHNHYSLLHIAAILDKANLVKLLVSKGADVDAVSSARSGKIIPFKDRGYNSTPLSTAAYLGKSNIVKLLLTFGADPNKKITKEGQEQKIIKLLNISTLRNGATKGVADSLILVLDAMHEEAVRNNNEQRFLDEMKDCNLAELRGDQYHGNLKKMFLNIISSKESVAAIVLDLLMGFSPLIKDEVLDSIEPETIATPQMALFVEKLLTGRGLQNIPEKVTKKINEIRDALKTEIPKVTQDGRNLQYNGKDSAKFFTNFAASIGKKIMDDLTSKGITDEMTQEQKDSKKTHDYDLSVKLATSVYFNLESIRGKFRRIKENYKRDSELNQSAKGMAAFFLEFEDKLPDLSKKIPVEILDIIKGFLTSGRYQEIKIDQESLTKGLGMYMGNANVSEVYYETAAQSIQSSFCDKVNKRIFLEVFNEKVSEAMEDQKSDQERERQKKGVAQSGSDQDVKIPSSSAQSRPAPKKRLRGRVAEKIQESQEVNQSKEPSRSPTPSRSSSQNLRDMERPKRGGANNYYQ